MNVSILVATDSNGAIGNENKLLWHLPADMKFFKEKTMGHHIIMGRKTYESIGRPLPGRTTVIITRDKTYRAEGCVVVYSLNEAIEIAKKANETEAMITGGAEIYRLAEALADTIYLTKVEGTFQADTFFHITTDNWNIKSNRLFTADEKNKYNYSFLELTKK